jgi:dTDP-4-amino-4,6-dideoxygalactose transaminase
MGAYSFHETKNVISGEGGALLINDARFVERAEIVREKGTNRSQFFRGQVDKYTWVDIGSSYLPGEVIAAFLWAQLEDAANITQRRINIWEQYHKGLHALERQGLLARPITPTHCQHNAHMYYILLNSLEARTKLIEQMRKQEIYPVFHYVPLHSSPAGKKYGRVHAEMTHTNDLSNRLLRLPMWAGLEPEIEHVLSVVFDSIGADNLKLVAK